MENYDSYSFFNFSIPIGYLGDCFDRYLVRLEEMRESLFIMNQCLNFLHSLESFSSEFSAFNLSHYASVLRGYMKYSMESLIFHFKFFTESFLVKRNETYTVVEAPKGEFGVYLVSDGTNRPYRCRIKAPGFLHLQGLDLMARSSLLADLVTIIGTQDLVFGEIDR